MKRRYIEVEPIESAEEVLAYDRILRLYSLNVSILAGVFVLVYAFIYKGIPGKGVQKGLIFGLIIWLVGCLPPVIRFAMTVNTSVALVAYWIIDGLLIYLFLGAIISAIYKK